MKTKRKVQIKECSRVDWLLKQIYMNFMKSKGKAAVGFDCHGLSLSMEWEEGRGKPETVCCLQLMELEMLIRTGKWMIITKKHCYSHLTSICHDNCYLRGCFMTPQWMHSTICHIAYAAPRYQSVLLVYNGNIFMQLFFLQVQKCTNGIK